MLNMECVYRRSVVGAELASDFEAAGLCGAGGCGRLRSRSSYGVGCVRRRSVARSIECAEYSNCSRLSVAADGVSR